ncbi:ankyrin repeat domain-containing protein [Archangium violaceum]|uniref:ankyrin repeat domain-containing protein n=1 Tax=Archangium violaceum TaxID=83451 RepID=UPI0037C0EE48
MVRNTRSRAWLVIAALALLCSCRGGIEKAIESGDLEKVQEALTTPEVQAKLPTQGGPWLVKAVQAKQFPAYLALVGAGADAHFVDSEGRTLLHHAAVAGAEDIVQELLRIGADPLRADGKGLTPVHEAITHRRGGLLTSQLLPKVPDVNALDKGRGGILAHAARTGDAELVTLLVKAGAVLDDPKAIPEPSHPEIQRQLEIAHLAYRVKSAVEKGDIETLKTLATEANEELMEALGLTPVHLAVLQNDRKALTELLKDNPKAIAHSDSRGLGLLHYAALTSEPRTAELLLSSHAGIDARTLAGQTPLMLAAQKGRALMVGALLARGASVNAEDANGQTALTLTAQGDNPKTVARLMDAGAVLTRPQPGLEQAHQRFQLRWAAETGSFAHVAALLRAGATDATTLEKLKLTPFHLAAIGNEPSKLEALATEKPEVLESLLREEGLTLLHWAAFADADKSVAWLVAKGFDVNATDSKSRQTPLEVAARAGHLAAAGQLVEKGAALQWDWRNLYDVKMREPLLRAIQNHKLQEAWWKGQFTDIPTLLREGAVAETLKPGPTPLQWHILRGEPLTPELEADLRKAEVDARDRTPLHYAVLASNAAALDVILRLAPDVNLRDKRGATALHEAAALGNDEAIRRLVQAGADVNLPAKDRREERHERTPLMAALEKESLPAVTALLDAGANLKAKTASGRIALEFALCEYHEEFAALLLSRGAPPEADVKCWSQAASSAISAGREEEALKFLEYAKPLAPGVIRELRQKAAKSGLPKVLRHLLERPEASSDKERAELLEVAAENGKRATLELLLEGGVPATPAFTLERTLGKAAYRGHPEVVSLLLERGADPLWTPEEGHSPVALALGAGKDKVIEVLAARPEVWAKVQADPKLLEPAVEGGFMDLVRGYVEAGADLKTRGTKMLGKAGSEAMVTYLIDKGVTTNSDAALQPDAGLDWLALYGEPFAQAVNHGELGIARLLLQHEARPQTEPVLHYFENLFLGVPVFEMARAKPKGGPEHVEKLRALVAEPAWTSEQLAELLTGITGMRCDMQPLIESILDRMKPEDIKTRTRTAVANLASCQDPSALELLVKRGADLNATDDSGLNVLADVLKRESRSGARTLLRLGIQTTPTQADKLAYVTLALNYRLGDVAAELLERAPADGRLGDAAALDSALLLAMSTGASDAAMLLVSHGARARAAGKEGETVLTLASSQGWSWIVDLLLELGAADPKSKMFRTLVEAKNWRRIDKLATLGDVSPHDLASLASVSEVRSAVLHLVLTRPDSVDRFIFWNVITEGQDVEFLELLLDELKPDIDTAGMDGNSLLIDAAGHSNLASVKLLVDRGANIHTMGIDCVTPVGMAMSRKDAEGRRIIRYFREIGGGEGDDPECGTRDQ